MNNLITRLICWSSCLTSTIFIHIMSGSLHWSSYTVCLSLLMYLKCNPPQQLQFLPSHQFYNSLILTTVYCSCCKKKNLLTLCTVYYSILCSTALHFLSKLHLNTKSKLQTSERFKQELSANNSLTERTSYNIKTTTHGVTSST